MSSAPQDFSPLRQFFWPIRRGEAPKFLPMAIMMFCILFNYTVLRNTKDSLVITAMGPEVLPFLKGFLVLPISMTFVILYSKLSNVLSRTALFYTLTGIFIVFFFLYAQYIYPYREFLEPHPSWVREMRIQHPHLQHVYSILGSWTYAAFYIFAELWGAVTLGLLFWQFANQITKISEAKRFYAMFAFLGHFALIIGGSFVQAPKGRSCDDHIILIIYAVIFFGFATQFCYWHINKFVITQKKYFDGFDTINARPKHKMSLRQSFREIFSSKYLGLIALLVFSYNFCMTLIGYVWKSQLRIAFPDALSYGNFMGQFQASIGIVTVLGVLFMKGIVERMSWFRGAVTTPFILLITGVIFFFFVLLGHWASPLTGPFHLTPVTIAVYIGAFQQLISKSCKYALFDPTKEMAYIPLNDDLKSKGKAAVDVFGLSFSKAFAGYLTGALLSIFAISDLMVIAPKIAFMIFTIIIIWIYGVSKLSTLYNQLVHRKHLDEE